MRIFIIFLFVFWFSYAEERVKYIMGVPVSVAAPEVDEQFFEPFRKVDKYFSLYRNDSVLCRLNREKQLKADKFFMDLLKKSIEINRETDGFFDISIGNITYRYGDFVEGCGFIKTDSYGMENILIKENQVFLKNGISLDFGGIAKGYAVDIVSDMLKKRGIKGIVKASGDIRCLKECEICIKDPFSDKPFACFSTKNDETGVSTSGIYERFRGSMQDNHLINPLTKKSASNIISITLIGTVDNTSLDAYATTVSVMPVERAVSFLNKKKLGFFLITKDCYLQGSFNSLYIKDLTFFSDLKECKETQINSHKNNRSKKYTE